MSNPRTIDYAKRNEALLLHADVTATAYQRGFEDYFYLHRYLNHFPLGNVDWLAYCQGNEDARKAEKDAHL